LSTWADAPVHRRQLELSDQMIRYWVRFAAAGDPNAPHVPYWPKYRSSTDVRMSLKACDTSPGSNQPPAACSTPSSDYSADHKTAFWASILG
jgi:para-nitrobenzyl esterase